MNGTSHYKTLTEPWCDKDFCIKAIENNVINYFKVSKELQQDPDIYQLAFSKNPNLLLYVKHPSWPMIKCVMDIDLDVISNMKEQSIIMCQYLSETLKEKRKVIMETTFNADVLEEFRYGFIFGQY